VLRKQGLLLEQEDDAAGFLGVRLETTSDGKLEMRQTGLINCVIDTMGLDNKFSKNKRTVGDNVSHSRWAVAASAA